ncbi:MAG TPA: efflux RND transporter periplasmic adaptor subunit [Rhodanobacteraceae bacterium]|nr:efflux RND transporter periplasmic adaptor subunit [Rhodanobacteraceae bacterium]
MGGLALLLTACSAGAPEAETQPAVQVRSAMPKMQVFHANIAAFGQLTAGTRNALTLTLPQAGQITAIETIAGQRVKRGAPLLELETDPATRSAYLPARSALKIARGELARTKHLRSENLATNAQLDAARKALADAQATLGAQAKLGGAQATSTLRAPTDGVVTALAVQRGERVAAGAALLQLAPTSAMEAQLGIDPGALADVRAGMPVTLMPVYAGHDAPPLHGTVAMVGDAVDPQSHMVTVIATLDSRVSFPAGTALSGSIVAKPFKAWAIPRNALQNDKQGDFVYQIEHGRARRVDVAVLAPDGSPVGVEGALDARAPVITLGSYEISEGDPVRGAAPPGSAPQGTAAR